MNYIKINIYSSTVNFTKLDINLDEKIVMLNKEKITLEDNDFFTIVNYVFDVIKKWDNIEKVELGTDIEIEVMIKMTEMEKKYVFTNEVPVNMHKIYELINDLEKIKYD